MAEFITFKEDKFKNQTIYKNSKHLKLDVFGAFWKSHMSYRRIVTMPDQDALAIDIYVETKGDWLHQVKGQLILLIDGEKITLEPHENYHDCEVFEGRTTYKESCYYVMSKDILKRICDSQSFFMKIYGDGASDEPKNMNAVVVYSKLFYNAVYDKTAYTDVVNNALGEFTRSMADESSFSDVKLDGSGANGGCMGMLVLMITMAGAAIGGVCSLI